MKLSPRQQKKLRDFLSDVTLGASDSPESEAHDLLADLFGSTPRAPAKNLPFKSRKRAKAERREAARVKTAGIYENVLKRSQGRCEACGLLDPRLEMDHLLGGYGRRKARESEGTCWMLCRNCHHLKTNNRPDARHWLLAFGSHCRSKGIAVPREVAAEEAWPMEGV